MLTPWWKRLPERLDFEFEALRLAGYRFEKRDHEFDHGLLVLDLVVATEDFGDVNLVAHFPDLYPYVRPEVHAPSLDLGRHQNPFAKNLCLLGRRSDAWQPEMTLAYLIHDQFKQVLEANRAKTALDATDLEEHQGEPISAFYAYSANAAVIIGDGLSTPLFGRACDAKFATLKGSGGVLTIVELRGPDGQIVSRGDPRIASSFENSFPGRWVRLDAPIRAEGGTPFDLELVRRHPELGRRVFVNDFDHILVGFTDEVRWYEHQLNWVMLVRKKDRRGISIKPEQRTLLRVQRVGVEDRATRVPQAATLASKRIAVFGVGCLGAPLALQFARCGVANLVLVDSDMTDAATTVRWPIGIPAAGQSKVAALHHFIELNYPWTNVTPVPHRIGHPNPSPPWRRDADVLDEVFHGADIIIDSTAEFGLQRMLSDLALEMRVPYIGLYATLGGVGGRVLRLLRGRTGCWRCVALHEQEGRFSAPPTLPDDSLVQPVGCGAATFIGGSFDLEEVTLMAMRLGIRTLEQKSAQDYPWEVATLALQGTDGRPIPPAWSTAEAPPTVTANSVPRHRSFVVVENCCRRACRRGRQGVSLRDGRCPDGLSSWIGDSRHGLHRSGAER